MSTYAYAFALVKTSLNNSMFDSQLEHDFLSRVHQPKVVEGHLQTNFKSIKSLLTGAKLKY